MPANLLGLPTSLACLPPVHWLLLQLLSFDWPLGMWLKREGCSLLHAAAGAAVVAARRQRRGGPVGQTMGWLILCIMLPSSSIASSP